MTASEELQKLMDNDELTESQQDNLLDFNVYQVEEAMDLFKEMLKDDNDPFGGDTSNGLSDVDIITTLYNLLDYLDDDYVVCEGYNGTVKLLDYDTLDDILDVE